MSRSDDPKKQAAQRADDRPRGTGGRFRPRPVAEPESEPVEDALPETPVAEEPVVHVEEAPPALPVAKAPAPKIDFPLPVENVRSVGHGVRDVYDRVNGYLLDVLRANEELTRQSVINQIRIEREQLLQQEFTGRKEEEQARLAHEEARTNQLRIEIESLTSERENAEMVKTDLQGQVSTLKSQIATLQAKNDGLDREVERLRERRDNLERDVARLEKLRNEYLETIEKIMARKEELSV